MEIWLEYLDGAHPHIAQDCVQNDGYRMVQMLDELFIRRSLDAMLAVEDEYHAMRMGRNRLA